MASRAVGYGLKSPISEEQRRGNRELCLMAQIETREAVERASEIASVPGQIDHPDVTAALERAIASAKASGRLVAMAAAPASVGRWPETSLTSNSDTSRSRERGQVVGEGRTTLLPHERRIVPPAWRERCAVRVSGEPGIG